jgi:hypothetical protein
MTAPQRPKIAPATAAALVAQIPSRLVKKLDADPTLASRWTWTRAGDTWAVKTDKDETVTLSGAEIVTAVGCTCLLSPKCLHVGAVVSSLEPADPSSETVGVGVSGSERSRESPTPTPTPNASTAVADQAFRALSAVLSTGAAATGAFAQAELLRAIHACRGAGLHRLAATQTRVLLSIRELRADRPEFVLPVLSADLRDALTVAHALARGDSAAALVGTARRDYESVGSLRLRGIFTEAIVARSGHAGAVTYLVDDKGTIYTRADVAPGDAARAAGAYDAPAAIGDAMVPHRELCRSGLFVSEATASHTRRLGAGQKVRAVRASEPSRWDQPPLVARWTTPLTAQLAAIASHEAGPLEQRPAGWDLVFVDGVVAGHATGVALVVGDIVLELAVAHDHQALVARDNLATLARATGVRARVIARVRLASPRRLDLLAIGPAAADETRLEMADAWHGRANVHYDRLSVVPRRGEAVAVASSAPRAVDDLLAPLRRRVDRVVLGGLATLPTHALIDIEREAAQLRERALRGGADVLRDLAAVAHGAGRGSTGARLAIDRPRFARAWLRAALYDDAARRTMAIASW